MPRRSGRRTDYDWSAIGDVGLGNTLAGAAATFGVTAFLSSLSQTLTRIRGRVGVTLDATAADENAIILCGITVVNNDTFTAGAAPEFQVDGGQDDSSWIWQGSMYVSSGAEAAVISDGLIATVEIDTKAMRRLKPNDSVAFVHQSPAALATDQGGTYDISYYMHMLLGR